MPAAVPFPSRARDAGESHGVLAGDDREAVEGRHESAVGRNGDGGVVGKPQGERGGHGRRRSGRARGGAREPRAPRRHDRSGCTAIQDRQRGVGKRSLVQPATLVGERRHRPSIEDHRVGYATDQGSLIPHRVRTGRETQCATDAFAHHLERHRRRLPEDAELAIECGIGVGILRVESHLLAATEHQHHATEGDQRPDGVGLVFAERSNGVEGEDCGQRVGWGEAVVMQQ